MVYLVLAFVTRWIISKSEKAERTNLGAASDSVSIRGAAAIIVVTLAYCVIAGLRAPTVGTDLKVYGINMYHLARDFTFEEFRIHFSSFAPLFAILSWGAARIAPTIQCYFFILQVPITLSAIAAIWLTGRGRRDLGVLLYGLFLFPISLNLIRQSMAIAFSLLAFSMMINGKRKAAVMVMLLSVFSHYSAAICMLPMVLYLIQLKCGKIGRLYPYAACFLAIALALLAYPVMLPVLAAISDYFAKYGNTGLSLGMSAVLVAGTVGLLLLTMLSPGEDPDGMSDQEIWVVGTIVNGCMMYLLSFHAMDLYRVALYLIAPIVLAPGLLWRFDGKECNVLKLLKSDFLGERVRICLDERKRLLLFYVLIVVFYLIYFVILRQHEVVPYALAFH